MSDIRKTISNRLISAREAMGWTQDDVAKACGLKTCAISHFECGRRMPTCKNLFKLAKALCVSMDYIFGMDVRKGIDKSETTCSNNPGNKKSPQAV